MFTTKISNRINFTLYKFFNQQQIRKFNWNRMRIERDSDNTITMNPNDGDHSATVILMHGLGDSADGWSDVAEQWASQMKHVKFILPTASSIPITMNGGMSMPGWYDIVGLSEKEAELCDGLDASISRIHDIIDRENVLGISHNRIALAGFSQGGAMSLSCGLQLPINKKPAGILVMSGYLPAPKAFNLTKGFEDLSILHCHGNSDPVVRFEMATKTRDYIQSKGATAYEFKSYPGLAHSVSPQEINYACEFLKEILPFNAEFAIPAKLPSQMSVKELKLAVRNNGLSSQAIGFSEKSEFVKLLEDHAANK